MQQQLRGMRVASSGLAGSRSVKLAAPVRASRTSTRRARSVVVEANLFARAARVIQSYANQIGACEAEFGEGAGQCWYCCVV
jgi:glycine cleavage system pyridoxal-binding protein P